MNLSMSDGEESRPFLVVVYNLDQLQVRLSQRGSQLIPQFERDPHSQNEMLNFNPFQLLNL
jgi:hypothetical protein